MGRSRLLLAVTVCAFALVNNFVVEGPSGTGCAGWIYGGAGCVTGSINGNTVDLSGHQTTSGSGGSRGTSSAGDGPGVKTPTAQYPNCSGYPSACHVFSFGTPPVTPGKPAVTLSDLENFTPTPGTDHMQPNGWMIVGLATNFYSIVGVEVQNGELLGQPASVRFTPIAWRWTYGDGSAATRSTPGGTWAAEGIPEFDATPTSHVYGKTGTYFIDLSIVFRAEYKWANGSWTPIQGTITLPANRLEATAGGAKTVLVGRDCLQNPSGPGC